MRELAETLNALAQRTQVLQAEKKGRADGHHLPASRQPQIAKESTC